MQASLRLIGRVSCVWVEPRLRHVLPHPPQLASGEPPGPCRCLKDETISIGELFALHGANQLWPTDGVVGYHADMFRASWRFNT